MTRCMCWAPHSGSPCWPPSGALTSDAAWQNFEEKRKGSIEAGKLADFVVLDRNPLTVSPAEIRNLVVVETFVAGRSVYRGSAGRN